MIYYLIAYAYRSESGQNIYENCVHEGSLSEWVIRNSRLTLVFAEKIKKSDYSDLLDEMGC